ncbi:MAG: gamma-glutamyl-gamma-aminobutyrate hydrolase family protein [Candidatus Neomarinimicrobiota bacterium]
MVKPLIGINPYYFNYRDDWWMATKQDYVNAITHSGGLPLTLHHTPDGEPLTEIVERIDGILMVGGPDFPSSMYAGEHPELLNEIIAPQRLAFDRSLFLEAFRQGKPMLAVCAGLQLINLIYGGTLYEDIPSQVRTDVEHRCSNEGCMIHPVRLDRNSLLFSIVGDEQMQVTSTHHQGIRRLGENLRAAAWSEDGLIEAVEDKYNPRAFIAIQWHPELQPADATSHRIFDWLTEEAALR